MPQSRLKNMKDGIWLDREVYMLRLLAEDFAPAKVTPPGWCFVEPPKDRRVAYAIRVFGFSGHALLYQRKDEEFDAFLFRCRREIQKTIANLHREMLGHVRDVEPPDA